MEISAREISNEIHANKFGVLDSETAVMGIDSSRREIAHS